MAVTPIARFSRDIYRHGIKYRRGHLAGNESFPDQFVEAGLIPLQILLYARRCTEHRGRPDGLVRFLCPLHPGLIHRRRRRQVVSPILLTDELARLGLGNFGHVGGVGSHVGDQADVAFIADGYTFIKTLGGSHGAFGSKN